MRRLRTGVTAIVAVVALQACGSDASDPVTDPPEPEPPTGTPSTILVKVVGAGIMRQGNYTVLLDGVPTRRTVSPYSSSVLSAAPGDRVVSLEGLPAWCAATDASRTVTVLADRQVVAEFVVTCSGVLVRASTRGEPPDVDGYRIIVDGDTLPPVLLANGTAVVGVVPGPRTITLGGLASHCRLDDGPASLEVEAAAENEAVYAVSCVGGVLRADLRTDGEDADADGYELAVTGGPAPTTSPVPGTGRQVVGMFPAGAQVEAALGGIAKNCRADATSRRAEIPAGDTVTVAFAISCTRLPSPGILLGDGGDYAVGKVLRYSPEYDELYTLGDGDNATWAPDGSKFAFSEGSSLRVVQRGTGVSTVVAQGYNPVFSADGRHLFFVDPYACPWYCSYPDQVKSVSLETGAVTVRFQRTGIVSFDISPDGERIAYISQDPVEYRNHLVLARLDGSDADTLDAHSYGLRPMFSPDGSQLLVYQSSSTFASYRWMIANADGSGSRPISGYALGWSPDGSRVLLSSYQSQSSTLFTVRASDGEGYQEVVRVPGFVSWASWK